MKILAIAITILTSSALIFIQLHSNSSDELPSEVNTIADTADQDIDKPRQAIVDEDVEIFNVKVHTKQEEFDEVENTLALIENLPIKGIDYSTPADNTADEPDEHSDSNESELTIVLATMENHTLPATGDFFEQINIPQSVCEGNCASSDNFQASATGQYADEINQEEIYEKANMTDQDSGAILLENRYVDHPPTD